jgi:DNA-binding FadR family transcriptional regulator
MTEVPVPPVRTRPATRRQEVTEQIKEYILHNQLAPGDPLPTESTLCAALGASRSSVREAIKMLSALDIVDVRHGHGTYVGRLSMAALVEGLAFKALLSSRDDFTVLGELIGVRQVLEQGLAGSIVEAFDDELRESLSDLVEQMRERAEAGKTFVDQDRAFHLLLMEPIGSQLVSQLTGAFWDVHAMVAPLLEPTDEDTRTTVDAHAAIVDAAAAGDVPAFVEAIAAHYRPVRSQLERHLSQPAGDR